MSAAAAAGTRAAAGERRRTEPAQASGRGGRCGRSARTQTVEAEDAVTVVPPEATEEGLLEVSPDTLCATGSLAPTRFPPLQPDFRVWLQPFPHPRRREPPVLPASCFRLPWSRHAPWGPAPSRGRSGRARAPRYRSAPSRRRTRAGVAAWTGEDGKPPLPSQPAEARNPFLAKFADKGALDFV